MHQASLSGKCKDNAENRRRGLHTTHMSGKGLWYKTFKKLLWFDSKKTNTLISKCTKDLNKRLSTDVQTTWNHTKRSSMSLGSTNQNLDSRPLHADHDGRVREWSSKRGESAGAGHRTPHGRSVEAEWDFLQTLNAEWLQALAVRAVGTVAPQFRNAFVSKQFGF